MATLGNLEALKAELEQADLVDGLEVLPDRTVRVHFSGTSEDAAELLRSLIHADIPLSEFHCTQENLETIFLKLGHQQAS